MRVALTHPLKDLKVVPGEKQVMLQWQAAGNPFIKHYEVVRHLGSPAAFGTGEATCYILTLQPTKREMVFVDTAVEEEADYRLSGQNSLSERQPAQKRFVHRKRAANHQGDPADAELPQPV